MILLNLSFELKDSDSLGAKWGLGKMYQLFGDRMDALIKEVNQELTA